MSTPGSENTIWSKIRAFLWPIYGRENMLFLPMTFMLALIMFNYYMVRGLKDTLVVKVTGGATVITFLKVYSVIPLAFLFFIVFAWLSNRFSRRNVFYIVIVPFLVYFGVYAFFMRPNQELLHPSAEFIQGIVNWFPEGALRNFFEGFFDMIRFWTASIFYAMAELWGSAVATLLFWQFANDITPVAKAKRFYAHFYILANLAVIFTGFLKYWINKHWFPGDFNGGVVFQTILVLLAGAGIIAIYYWINKSILTRPEFQLEDASAPKVEKKKAKMSLGESFKFLFKSPYLGLIAVLVLCYGVSINLAEVLWKDLQNKAFPTESEYEAFQGLYYVLTGAVTVVIILIGSTFLRKFGWRKTALATPILLGGSSVVFFFCAIFSDVLTPLASIFGVSTAVIAVWLGLIQNLLSKPTKYAMFDPTKEMAYIPLDPESKMKGKAAVDVVGGRLGKSGGAFVQQGLKAFVGKAIEYAPYSLAITVGIVAAWSAAVIALGKRFKALTGEK